jgi:hypothetical protein
VTATEGLPSEHQYNNTPEVAGAVRSHQLDYNSFLGAGSDYLVTTATEENEVFSHYETYDYQRCTDTKDVTRQVCHVRWKKIANPDYVPRSTSAVSCGSDLKTCLLQKGPTLSRYIFIADGQDCADYTTTVCTQWETAHGSYPKYDTVASTHFTVYRFHENSFVRLDDQVLQSAGNAIGDTGLPVTVDGRIADQRRLHLNGNLLYAVSSDRALATFSLSGNSIIRTGLIPEVAPGLSVSAAQFTANKAVIAVSKTDSWTTAWNESRLATIDLTTPETPILSGDISISGEVQQLLVTDVGLIGLGSVRYRTGVNTINPGRISLFSGDGSEKDSLLFGLDDSWVSSSAFWDDQVAPWNADSRLLLLPYSGASEDHAVFQNHLLLATADADQVSELMTFTFDEGIVRSLVVDPNTALAFSNSYIHLLKNQDGWKEQSLVSAVLPEAVYKVANVPFYLRRISSAAGTVISSAPETDIFAAQPVDTLTLDDNKRWACFGPRTYFTANLILAVSVTPDVYQDWNDCPEDPADLSLQFKGWRVGADGKFTPANPSELPSIYELISKDIQCVLDTTNFDGHEVEDGDATAGTCYPRAQYDEIISEHSASH